MPDRTELVLAYADSDVEIAQRLRARFAEAGFRPVLAGFGEGVARWELPRAATAVCLFSQETAGRVTGWSGDAAVVLALVDVDEPPEGWRDAGAVVRRWDWAGGTFSRVVSVLDRTRLRGVLDVLLGTPWPLDADGDPAPPPADVADPSPLATDVVASPGTGDAGESEEIVAVSEVPATKPTPVDPAPVAMVETPALATGPDAPPTRAEIAEALAALLASHETPAPWTVGFFGPVPGRDAVLRDELLPRLAPPIFVDRLFRLRRRGSGPPRLHPGWFDAAAQPPGISPADVLVEALLHLVSVGDPKLARQRPRRFALGPRALRRTGFGVAAFAVMALFAYFRGALTGAEAAVAALAIPALVAVMNLLLSREAIPVSELPPGRRDEAHDALFGSLEASGSRLALFVDGLDASPRDDALAVYRAARWLTDERRGTAVFSTLPAGLGPLDVDLPLWLPPAAPGEMAAEFRAVTAPARPGFDEPSLPDVAALERTRLTGADLAALEAVLPHLPPHPREAGRIAVAYRFTRALLAASPDAGLLETPETVARWLALVARAPSAAAALAAAREARTAAEPLSVALSAAGDDAHAVRRLLESSGLTWSAIRALSRVTLHADLTPSASQPAAPSLPAASDDEVEALAPAPRRPTRRIRAAAPAPEPEPTPAAAPAARARRPRKPAAASPEPAPEPPASPKATESTAADQVPEVFVDPNQLGLF